MTNSLDNQDKSKTSLVPNSVSDVVVTKKRRTLIHPEIRALIEKNVAIRGELTHEEAAHLYDVSKSSVAKIIYSMRKRKYSEEESDNSKKPKRKKSNCQMMRSSIYY